MPPPRSRATPAGARPHADGAPRAAHPCPDPSDGRWVHLTVVVAALAITTDAPARTVRSTVAELGLADVRPRRLELGDGTAALALVGDTTPARHERLVADAIASPGGAGVSVAWSAQALVDWLEGLGLGALAPETWRRGIRPAPTR